MYNNHKTILQPSEDKIYNYATFVQYNEGRKTFLNDRNFTEYSNKKYSVHNNLSQNNYKQNNKKNITINNGLDSYAQDSHTKYKNKMNSVKYAKGFPFLENKESDITWLRGGNPTRINNNLLRKEIGGNTRILG